MKISEKHIERLNVPAGAKNEELVIITAKEHTKLLDAYCFLSALEAAGVDNWDGYGEAQNILEEWNS